MNNFLVPAMIVRLGQYISFENNNGIAKNVVYSTEPQNGNYIMMQEVGGSEFVCKIRSNVENINVDFIKTFLAEKASGNIDKAFKLKIKDSLENDDAFAAELEKILEEKQLPRKEEKQFEKDFIEQKIDEIAFAEKLIKPGSIVRLPVSSSKEGEIAIDGKTFPIYESLCLIRKENGEVSESGIYYVSQNRHGIPLRLRNSLKDKDSYFWETNNDIITKDEFVTLLRHGIRTIEQTGNFFLYCRGYETDYEGFVKGLTDEYIHEPDELLKKEKYILMLERFIDKAEEESDFHKKVIVSLPTKIGKDFVINMENSVLSKQPMAISNLLFKNDDNKSEKALFVEQEMKSFLKDNEKLIPLYGVYSIISTYDSLESDTYGFLKNNLKPSSIMLGLSDYVNFISMVKGSNTQEVVKYKEYNSSYLNEDLNNEGYLDI